MSIFNLLQRIPRPATRQVVIGLVYLFMLSGAIGLGLASRQHTSAAVQRNCSTNSIDYAQFPNPGDCGAATPAEMIADIKHNVPGDLKDIYADPRIGLSSDKYTRFQNEAVDGTIFLNGDVKTADGQLVMTNAWTMGRSSFGNPQRLPISINNKTYYHAPTQVSFSDTTKEIPVMILFNDQGVAEVVIEKPCGNPIPKGDKKTPKVTCDALVPKQNATNPNKWSFTTDAHFEGPATLDKVVYHFSDTNEDVTKTSLAAPVEHTFAKDGEVTVTVFAKVPGGHIIKSVAVIKCSHKVKHESPKAVCTALVPITLDDKKQKFRFTVKTSMGDGVSVKNADFNVDSKTTTTETTKDGDGNIYKEYTFTDDQKHIVKVTVRFNTVEGEKTDICQAEVTSSKTPVCTVPGHEGKPIDDQCGYCKPGVPIGSPECLPPKLVDTGPGGVVGLFAGTSLFGALGHHFLAKWRNRRGE